MSEENRGKTVTFYHSAVCPRCHVSGRFLAQLLPEFPAITVKKVEYLTHLGEAHGAGIRTIPSLVCDSRRLSGFVLTKARIREFLESV